MWGGGKRVSGAVRFASGETHPAFCKNEGHSVVRCAMLSGSLSLGLRTFPVWNGGPRSKFWQNLLQVVFSSEEHAIQECSMRSEKQATDNPKIPWNGQTGICVGSCVLNTSSTRAARLLPGKPLSQ